MSENKSESSYHEINQWHKLMAHIAHEKWPNGILKNSKLRFETDGSIEGSIEVHLPAYAEPFIISFDNLEVDKVMLDKLD